MPLTIAQFWKLLADSRLVTAEHCQQLQLDFARAGQGAAAQDPHAVGSWLVAKQILTAYQSTILLNGHSGPFFYGDYRVQDRMTSGRFDGYFQAIHQPTAHPVLLQFVSGDQYQESGYWHQFVSHVHNQSLISGPTLQGVHEVLDVGDFRLVAYEDLGEGQTAAQLLVTGGRLTTEDTCRLAWSVVHALVQMQQAGVTHGSVCPNNLWIASSGHLYLLRNCTQRPEFMDFSRLDQDLDLQAMVDCVAPELATGQQGCSILSDMYAFGCTCYELLSGQPPFHGPGLAEKVQQHATLAVQPLESVGVPADVAQLISYLMAKNPQLRYQDYGDLLQKLATQVKPADQNIPLPTSLATQASYLALVQQRQATVAAKAAANAVAPANTPQVQTDTASSNPAVIVSDELAPTSPASSTMPASIRRAPAPWWQSSAIIWSASALGVLIVTMLIMFNLPEKEKQTADNGKSKKPATDKLRPVKALKNGNKTLPTKETEPTQTVVDDPQGELLWASPTQGAPFKLTLVPPAGQLFMLIRPASLLDSEPGQLTLDALGPRFNTIRTQWEQEAGVKLADIETMVMTLHDNDEAFPRPSFVIQLKEAQQQDQLLVGWGNPQPSKTEGSNYFKGDKWCFFVPSDGDNRTFVMGVEEDVREVATNPTSIAPLRRELAELLKTTDDSRHFTLLFAPNFLSSNLFRDGRELFFGDAAKVRKPLEWLIGEDVKAGLLSVHLAQHFYLEARLSGGLGKDKFTMARTLRERMEKIPQQIEEYFAILNPPPYWRLLANRYPRMVQQLHQQTRIGVEQGHAMINVAMQPTAAHNLVLGGELCLASTPGAEVVVTDTPQNGPQSIDEVLTHKFSVDIPQNDLELAVKDIVNDVRDTLSSLPFEFNIKIIGPELKLEGITRNQAVRDFKATDKPLSEILTGMVSKANPDPSVKDPSQPAQKLVWVIADDPDKAGNRIILITTRKDAEEEKYPLPKPFQPK
jgi:serine/threonine protein kinase